MKLNLEEIINQCKKCGDGCGGCPFDGGDSPWTAINGEPIYCYWAQFPLSWDLKFVKNYILKDNEE